MGRPRAVSIVRPLTEWGHAEERQRRRRGAERTTSSSPLELPEPPPLRSGLSAGCSRLPHFVVEATTPLFDRPSIGGTLT